MEVNKNYEEHCLILAEARGVAGFKWRGPITAIINYIKQRGIEYFNKLSGTDDGNANLNFDIPKSLTDKIDFINDFKITVKLRSPEKGERGGSCDTRKASIITDDGKLGWARITLQGWLKMGVVQTDALFGTLYHEINHAYDHYCSLMNVWNGNERYGKSSMKADDISLNDLTSLENGILNEICYRLFSETEFNALVASVYGDLENMNSERVNFRNDFKRTQGYETYKIIEDNYKIVFNSIKDPDILTIFGILQSRGVKFKYDKTNIVSIRKELIRKVRFLLEKLIWKMARAASLYYENKEDDEREKNKDGIIGHFDEYKNF